MRVQLYIIATLLGLILWAMSYDAARDAYHEAREAGLPADLHRTIRSIL